MLLELSLDSAFRLPNNASMSIFLARSLALAAGFLLVLPPSWCCTIGVGECCGTEPQSGFTPSRTEERPDKPEGPCCCCKDKGSEKSSQKTPSSRPAKPDEPGKSVCCERLPIDRQANVKPMPDLSAFIPGYVLQQIATRQATFADVCNEELVLSSSPVHILHCVWLC
jgi:hypothetical protein